MINARNLFADIPDEKTKEVFEELLRGGNFRVERIVSHGEASPDGSWYDQDENEWVMLLSGAAELSFDDGSRVVLAPGDCILIPGHTRHRVEKTDRNRETIWLAIHFVSSFS